MAHMTKVVIDYSGGSSLAVCAECCWRELAATRAGALVAASTHARVHHADAKAADKYAERARGLKR